MKIEQARYPTIVAEIIAGIPQAAMDRRP